MDKDYKKSFYLSLAGHGLLFVVLLVNSFFNSPQIILVGGGSTIEKQDKPIIQAGLINHEAVKNAITRQEQQERNKQKQLALQKATAEKLKKEAEKVKREAEKLKQEVAAAQKKAEQEKKLALVAKENAEKAKLQAAKEKEQAKLAKEQAVQKLEKIKQAKLQAAREQELAKKAQEQAAAKRKQVLAEEARQSAERARHAQELALQQAAAEHGRWIDSEFSRYAGEIQRKVLDNRIISTAFSPDLSCDIQIKLLPDGSVHDVKLIRSSGNAAYDSMSEAAVYKAAPFDMPEDRELMSKLRDIVLVFKVAEDGNG